MNNNTKTRAALAGSLLAAALLGGVKRPVLADEASPNTDNAALQSRIDNLEKLLNDQAAQLNELKKEQADLQKKSDAADKAGPAVGTKTKIPLTFNGLVQIEGLTRLSEDSPTNTPGTFRLRRGQFGLQAQITPKVSATASFDFAKKNNTSTSAADSILQDLYVSYLLNQGKDKQNSNFIDVGQQKVPFGYESLLSSSALPLVEAGLMYQERDPDKGNYGNGRDTGVQLRGTQGKFDYRLGIFNGLGEQQNTLALSDAKAFIGRVGYHFTPDLQVGVSGGHANTGINAAGQRADRSLWNGYAVYNHAKLTLQGEYTQGDYSDPLNRIQDIRSYYGHVGYYLTPKLEGVARADFLTFRNVDADVKQYTVGLNYYLKGNNAKIQLDLVHTDGDPASPDANFRYNSNELRTLFQVAF